MPVSPQGHSRYYIRNIAKIYLQNFIVLFLLFFCRASWFQSQILVSIWTINGQKLNSLRIERNCDWVRHKKISRDHDFLLLRLSDIIITLIPMKREFRDSIECIKTYWQIVWKICPRHTHSLSRRWQRQRRQRDTKKNWREKYVICRYGITTK